MNAVLSSIPTVFSLPAPSATVMAFPAPVGVASAFSQPKIVLSDDAFCLLSGYQHGEVFVDLWGTYDKDEGYKVEGFTMTGDKSGIDLTTLPGAGSHEQLSHMENYLCITHDKRMADGKGDARLERHFDFSDY